MSENLLKTTVTLRKIFTMRGEISHIATKIVSFFFGDMRDLCSQGRKSSEYVQKFSKILGILRETFEIDQNFKKKLTCFVLAVWAGNMAYVLRTRGTTLPSTSSSGVFHKSFSKGSVSFSHTYVHPYLYTATSRKATLQNREAQYVKGKTMP